MKKAHTLTAIAVLALTLTGCGGTEETPEPKQENFAVVYPGQNRDVEIPIELNDPARIKTEENKNLLQFTVTEVRRDAICTKMSNFTGTPTEVHFKMTNYGPGYNDVHTDSIYNPLGWSYEYNDGSVSDGTSWASLKCEETLNDTESNDTQSIKDGVVTLILPDSPGKLVYKDYRTGAVFKLPLE